MKQRHHRKAVQQRMREAPTEYDRHCAFYEGHRWKKRDSKKILRRPMKPLQFNCIQALPLTVIDTMASRHAGRVEPISLREPPVFDNEGDAMDNALKTGEGWALVGGTLEGRAAGRAEFMRNLTDAAIFEALKAR